jgi:membrane protease YdiL (CAAX protease family)
MSKLKLLTGKMSPGVTIDILWAFLVVIATVTFGYLTTFIDLDPGLATKGLIGYVLLIGSTFFTSLLVGFKIDNFFSVKDIVNSSGWILVSIGAVIGVTAISQGLSSVTFQGSLFVMLMGIAEETMFRGFLLTLFVKMTGNQFMAIGASSFMGAVYHAAIYGTSNELILIVFGCFCVLGFAYVGSGYRLSVPMVAHALINLIASIG